MPKTPQQIKGSLDKVIFLISTNFLAVPIDNIDPSMHKISPNDVIILLNGKDRDTLVVEATTEEFNTLLSNCRKARKYNGRVRVNLRKKSFYFY